MRVYSKQAVVIIATAHAHAPPSAALSIVPVPASTMPAATGASPWLIALISTLPLWRAHNLTR